MRGSFKLPQGTGAFALTLSLYEERRKLYCLSFSVICNLREVPGKTEVDTILCCVCMLIAQLGNALVAVAGVWMRVSWRMILALGPRRALACAAVSTCSARPT